MARLSVFFFGEVLETPSKWLSLTPPPKHKKKRKRKGTLKEAQTHVALYPKPQPKDTYVESWTPSMVDINPTIAKRSIFWGEDLPADVGVIAGGRQEFPELSSLTRQGMFCFVRIPLKYLEVHYIIGVQSQSTESKRKASLV